MDRPRDVGRRRAGAVSHPSLLPCVKHGVWHTAPKTAPVQVSLSYFVPPGLGCFIFKGKTFGGALSGLKKKPDSVYTARICEHRWGEQLLAHGTKAGPALTTPSSPADTLSFSLRDSALPKVNLSTQRSLTPC